MGRREPERGPSLDGHRFGELRGLPGVVDRLVIERAGGPQRRLGLGDGGLRRGRSAMVRRDPWLTLPAASSTRSVIAPRALPSAAAAIESAKKPKIGKRYSGSSTMRRPSSSDRVRRDGTNTPSATVSWLPVPRRPLVCQVSRISSSSTGIATTRRAGGPGSWRVPSSRMHPANS